jgi:hypothetical protein
MINFVKGNVVADLDVKSATILSDIRRERIMAKVWSDNNIDPNGNKKPLEVDDDTYYLNIHIFPAMVCCTEGTIKVDGKDYDYRDFEKFKAIDRDLFKQWREIAMATNPDYFGLSAETPNEQEKKAST